MSLLMKHKPIFVRGKRNQTSVLNQHANTALISYNKSNMKQSGYYSHIQYPQFNRQQIQYSQSQNQIRQLEQNQNQIQPYASQSNQPLNSHFTVDKEEETKRIEYYKRVNNAMWMMLHSRAATFPISPTRKRIEEERAWAFSFGANHPCVICSTHYKQMFSKDIPFNAKSRIEYFTWTWKIHNSVNRRLGKKEMTFNDALKSYHVAV